MREPITFPRWILAAIEEHQGQLNPKSLDFFNKLVELFPDFDNAFLSIPATSEIGVLTSLDPSVIKAKLGVKSPLEFILMNTTEMMHFHFVYQMRELGLSLLAALHEGKFYVAALIIRAMLEVVCVNYSKFRCINDRFNESFKFMQSAARTRSAKEQSILIEKYHQGLFEAFSHAFNANAASSFDSNNNSFKSWPEYMEKMFEIKVLPGENINKSNAHSAIKDIEKRSKLSLMQAYDVMNEFVHPNLGSKMLVINTKKQHHPQMDVLKLGDNRENTEAALFYFDHLSEGAYYSWTLALSLFNRGQDFITMLDSLCAADPSRTVH